MRRWFRESQRHSERGMTLVEIIVVISLIILIMGVVIQGVIGKKGQAQFKLNQVKMEQLRNSLETYRLDYNQYPSKLDDLLKPSAAVLKTGKPFMALAKPDDLLDVWGNPFIYSSENNGRGYSITSMGSDGVAGGEDDKQDITVKN